MKIFKSEPKDWSDLQNKYSKLFGDIGFVTQVEKNIKTVREIVNVDVLAVNETVMPNEIVLVECKNWGTNVPKTVVHAFRSVVNDYGANAGYIISKVGFQKGAFEAVKNTNIKLMNFDEFQEHFRIRYLSFAATKAQKIGYPLRKYSDRMETIWDSKVDKLSKEKKAIYSQLCIKYDYPSMASILGNYKNLLTGELHLEYIDNIIKDRATWFADGNIIDSYSEYFDLLNNFCQQGVDDFDALFGEKLRKE